MKIKAIAQICARTKFVTIYNDASGEQWLSDGGAAYPIYDLPELDERSVLAIFDVPADKWPDWQTLAAPLPTSLNFADDDDSEKQLTMPRIRSINKDGKIRGVALTSKGLRLYNLDYLKPLEDDFKLYERETADGEIYLAAKAGVFLKAVIMPLKINYTDFLSDLHQLTDAASRAKEIQRREGEP